MRRSRRGLSPRPRRRLMGLAFGTTPGGRRGVGSDVAGSRPYVRGDSMDAIDWSASARASAALGTDEFIVREHFADDAPRVVMVVDRRPEMAPRRGRPLAAEGRGARGGDDGRPRRRGARARRVPRLRGGADAPFWRPPASSREPWSIRAPPAAPRIVRRRTTSRSRSSSSRAPPLDPEPAASSCPLRLPRQPPRDVWERVVEHWWDIVPVIVQDPIWGQSPPVDGIVLRSPARTGGAARAPEGRRVGGAPSRARPAARRAARRVRRARSSPCCSRRPTTSTSWPR